MGFGLLLIVLVQWGQWKALAIRLAVFFGLAAVVLPMTRTGQAGQLLYATVLPLAPDESKVAPGFAARVRPLRDEIRARQGALTNLQSLEQRLTEMTGDYLSEQGVIDPDTNALCQKLAFEACLHEPLALPGLAIRKFLSAAHGPISIGYDEPRLQQKLNIGFNRKGRLGVLSKRLTGMDLKDEAGVAAFVAAHYHVMPWYDVIEVGWNWLTKTEKKDNGLGATAPPRLPAFFAFGLIGMAVVAATAGRLRKFQIAWLLSLAGLWFAVHLAGVVNPRYRFVFEPFCLIYAILGLTIAGARIFQGLRIKGSAASLLPDPGTPMKPSRMSIPPGSEESVSAGETSKARPVLDRPRATERGPGNSRMTGFLNEL